MSNARKLADNLPSVGQLGNRNVIINGAFQVAQRGTSATGVTAGAYNTVDRFQYAEGSGGGSAGFTVSQSTEAPDGFSNSFKLEVTTTDTLTGGENCLIRTRLEGQNMQRFKSGTSDAESITVSFYVRASVTGTYGVQLMLGPSANATALQSITVNSANTWEYKTLTFAGSTSYAIPNDTSRGFDLNIMLDSGPDDLVAPYTFAAGVSGAFRAPTGQANFVQNSGATFHITGIQVEVGTEATPFEHRSFGDELARCQRYTYVVKGDDDDHTGYIGYSESTTNARFGVLHPVPMRAAPSFTLSGTCRAQGGTADSANFTSGLAIISPNTSHTGACIRVSGTSNLGAADRGYNLQFKADGSSLTFDAEL